MHSEHLQNVSTGRVMMGWLVAVAVSSLVLLALAAVGMSPVEAENTWASILAVIIGFFAGGFFTGMRALRAPILHGIAIGLMSLVVWVVLNVIVFGLLSGAQWEVLTPLITTLLLFAQIVSAVIGALVGYNVGLAGKPGLSEHPTAD
ncbi:MAG TPA: hypothetical protein VF035_06115 [Longimicrobiales bacterium]